MGGDARKTAKNGLCVVCRSDRRLVRNLICVSCYNRILEASRGRNARGGVPVKVPTVQEGSVKWAIRCSVLVQFGVGQLLGMVFPVIRPEDLCGD